MTLGEADAAAAAAVVAGEDDDDVAVRAAPVSATFVAMACGANDGDDASAAACSLGAVVLALRTSFFSGKSVCGFESRLCAGLSLDRDLLVDDILQARNVSMSCASLFVFYLLSFNPKMLGCWRVLRKVHSTMILFLCNRLKHKFRKNIICTRGEVWTFIPNIRSHQVCITHSFHTCGEF